MRGITLTGIGMALFVSISAQAGVEVLRSDWNSTILRFELDGQGFVTGNRPGEPAFPRQGVSIQIPASSRATLEVLSEFATWEDRGIPLPGRGAITREIDPRTVPYIYGPLYRSATAATPARITRTFVLRDVLGAHILFAPYHFDPATNLTRVTRELTVAIRTPQIAKRRALFTSAAPLAEDFAALYPQRFLNFGKLSHVVVDTSKLLVIAHPSLAAAMKPFVDWKNQKGIATRLVTLSETGATHTQIAAYIAQAYRAERVSSVLLVGDAELVPTFPGVFGRAWKLEADPLYGAIEGPNGYNDEYPEVFISRFPAKTGEQAATMGAKVIAYERDAEPGDWYAKAAGIAGAGETGGDGFQDWQRADLLAQILKPWGYSIIDKLYAPTATLAQITAALNEGRGFINYVGHGLEGEWVSPRVTAQDVRALTNDRKLPFIVSVACLNGHFAGPQETLAEAWMLAGTPETPRGAIGIFASSANQAWIEPTIGQKAIAELLTQNRFNTLGTLFLHGSVAVLDADMWGSNQTFETWHIFGDATTQVRTRSPEAVAVEGLPTELSTTLNLKVSRPGAVIAVSQDGRLIGRGIVAADGTVKVALDSAALQPGKPALITLTGFNLRTQVHEVMVQGVSEIGPPAPVQN